MRSKIFRPGLATAFLLMASSFVRAQGNRAQYPPALVHSYFGVNLGRINYPFSQQQLEPGYSATSIHVPHTALRVVIGHQFTKYLSAQISYMRPIDWVEYKNVNGSGAIHKVGMNVGGLTLRSDMAVSRKFFLHGEAGLGVITRGGFFYNDEVVVKDAAFASILLGGGLNYRLNRNWELSLSTTWSPAYAKAKQPSTSFYAAGFKYTMQPLPEEKVRRNSNSGYFFPRRMIQVGFTTNGMGYGVNDFVSKGAVPIFWGGNVQVARGFSLNFQRNVFHTRRVFSLDWGAGFSFWKSKRNKEDFQTFSLFPVFRFTLIRSKAADLYLNYSVAGPAFITRTIIDRKNTGEKFTFQDFMGIGLFSGKKRKLNTEIRICHYSNGNIFPQNNGVMIPLTFTAGYAFD